MFLANVIHETNGLKALREDNPKPQEYRVSNQAVIQSWEQRWVDLEKKYPNNHYYGRGYLQLSWVYNYYEASQALFGNERLVQNPDLVCNDQSTAWKTAFWFWETRVHPNRQVQRGDLDEAINIINSIDQPSQRMHRHSCYKGICSAFGI
jgi:predicted chitinase